MKKSFGALQLVTFLALVFAGCASGPVAPRVPRKVEKPIADNSAYLNTVLPAWIGHPASELITAWGKPTSTGQPTPGSYGGRGGIYFGYFIGQNGSIITLPEVSSYTDLEGVTHLHDSSTIIVPHFVQISFDADLNGIIISDDWLGTNTDVFDPARYPMPSRQVTLPVPVSTDYIRPTGGHWSEPTAEEARAKRDQVTPDNILEKLDQMQEQKR